MPFTASREFENAIGVIGVGSLGGALLGALLAKGIRAAAYDVRRETFARPMFEQHAERLSIVDSPRELAVSCPLVSVVVRDEQQLRDVLEGQAGVLAGARSDTLILVHSTVHPDFVRGFANSPAVVGCGARLLDAAISIPSGAHQGIGFNFLLGGEAADVARARAVLGQVGNVMHLGPLGMGMNAKVVRNACSFVCFAAVTEALETGIALGMSEADVIALLRSTGLLGEALEAYVRFRYEEKRAAFTDEDAIRVGELMQKDLAIAAGLANAAGAPSVLTEALLAAGVGRRKDGTP